MNVLLTATLDHNPPHSLEKPWLANAYAAPLQVQYLEPCCDILESAYSMKSYFSVDDSCCGGYGPRVAGCLTLAAASLKNDKCHSGFFVTRYICHFSLFGTDSRS